MNSTIDQAPKTVLLTDFAWPDVEVERAIIENAGYMLVIGSHDPISQSEVESLAAQTDPVAIMTCWSPVSRTAIKSAPRLRIVARMGVGLDNIAVETATASGAWVTNVPDYCVEEVSDHAVALALSWIRGVTQFDRTVRAGQWSPSQARLGRMSSKTVGIIGYGRIGRATVRKLHAFDCSLLITDQVAVRSELAAYTSLQDLLARSDIVILHVPLTPQTHHLIGRVELAAMKSTALLVNVSRGGLVDTDALVDALENGQIGAAALDVLEHEPFVAPGLLAHPGVTITPHVAFSSEESLIELRTKAAEEVVRVLRGGEPRSPCNNPALSAASAECS